MYKYRAIEHLPSGATIAHGESDTEDIAKADAKRIVNDTHHSCYIQRYNGSEWQNGSIRYMWYFGQVCFWNHR